MASPLVSIEPEGDITVIRLDRPPANAIVLELAQALSTAFDTKEVKSAKALVVTGSGGFFSGGLDLKIVPTYSAEQQHEFLATVNRMIGRIYSWPKPVIAAVNGHAIAGAFMLVLATDYRIGPEGKAQFGLTEARVGIPFPAAPMIVLNHELAPQDVRYTALYARNFGPEEALRRGVFDELRPPQDVLARGIEIARDMATMPGDSYWKVKHQVRRPGIEAIEKVIQAGSDPMLKSWLSTDAAEAGAQQLKGE